MLWLRVFEMLLFALVNQSGMQSVYVDKYLTIVSLQRLCLIYYMSFLELKTFIYSIITSSPLHIELGLENWYWNVKTAFTSWTTGLSACLTCKGVSCTRAATYSLPTCSLLANFGVAICTYSYVSLDNSSSCICLRTTLKEIDVLLTPFIQ